MFNTFKRAVYGAFTEKKVGTSMDYSYAAIGKAVVMGGPNQPEVTAISTGRNLPPELLARMATGGPGQAVQVAAQMSRPLPPSPVNSAEDFGRINDMLNYGNFSRYYNTHVR